MDFIYGNHYKYDKILMFNKSVTENKRCNQDMSLLLWLNFLKYINFWNWNSMVAKYYVEILKYYVEIFNNIDFVLDGNVNIMIKIQFIINRMHLFALNPI